MKAEKIIELDKANARELRAAFCEGFAPTVRLSVADWCEKHVDEIPYSPIPGPFRAYNAPQMRDVMAAIVNPRVRLVFVMASIQSSKTLSPELALAYIIPNLPGPTLWLDVTDDAAKLQSETRLQPLFDHCAPVKELLPADKNKRRNRTIFFTNGATLWILGASNRRNLQSRSIRWLFGDETWQWPTGRMVEAEARVAAFGRLGKCVFTSQAGAVGDDTDRKFRTTTQSEWCFQCPVCGRVQPYKWENVHWDKAAKDVETGKWDFQKVAATAHMLCEACGARFEDSAGVRTELMKSGRFVVQNHDATAGAVGFRWNSLAFMEWGKLAEMFLRAKENARKGKIADLAAFYQQRLATPWQDEFGDFDAAAFSAPESGYKLGDENWELEGRADAEARVFVCAKDFAGDAAAPRLRFLTADVQDGYFYFVVRMWSPSGDSRLLAAGMAQTFDDLRDIRDKWKIHDRFVFIDGGYLTQRVAAFCAENNAVMLLGDRMAGRAFFKHADRQERVYSPRRVIKAGNGKVCESFYFSNLSCKDKLAELRRGESERWEIPCDISPDYIKQMGNEYRSESGNGKPIWLRKGSRPNHFFDCETMQVAAAFMLKILGGNNNAEPASTPKNASGVFLGGGSRR